MRLIFTPKLEFHEFIGPSVPPYVILSHTWGDEEVTYQDMITRGSGVTSKKGYTKIVNTCLRALEESYEYAWIDTCCIDKRSSAELTEAINSMFSWYRAAGKCYVLLSDLSRDSSSLTGCRWFTRGWTLQELLAPKHVEFYDQSWNHRGTKSDWKDAIAWSTGISTAALCDAEQVSRCSVAIRMSWAARRQTTRVEDLAYCLLGIFDVNMALLYGEGHKSFRRLQEEIVKRTHDLTVFAWQNPTSSVHQAESMLAASPSCFSPYIALEPFVDDFVDFSITNNGLRISGETVLRIISTKQRNSNKVTVTYMLLLGTRVAESSSPGGICLRKIGPHFFCRDGRYPLVGFGLTYFQILQELRVQDYYILTDLAPNNLALPSYFREGALHVLPDETWTLKGTSPQRLWDETDRTFLNAIAWDIGHHSTLIFAQYSAMFSSTKVEIVAVCKYMDRRPYVRLFRADSSTSKVIAYIFHTKHLYAGRGWDDIIASGNELPESRSNISISLGEKVVDITAEIIEANTKFEDCSVNAFGLRLRTVYAEQTQT